MVVEGCRQLGRSLYRWMIASLHKKQQNLKEMIKHKFLNDKTEHQHLLNLFSYTEMKTAQLR